MSPAIPLSTADRLVTLDHLVTLEEWENDWSQREENHEFVDGQPLMVPGEHPFNLSAATRLTLTLWRVLGDDWEFLQSPGLLICQLPLTVRLPDLAVAPPGADLGRNPLDPTAVVLVVENLSSSTRGEDLGRKRHDYASAAIPNYLIVDRYANPRLTLLTDPADGDYRTAKSGQQVTLRVTGREIVLRAADFVR